MKKCFNINGACYSDENYMVNLDGRAEEIKKLIDGRKYFVINRARQYGKTTTLNWLADCLAEEYGVFLISFEGLGDAPFEKESSFCHMFCELLCDAIDYGEAKGIFQNVREILATESKTEGKSFRQLSNLISTICKCNGKPMILIIDEVDQASNHKVFLDFLGVLRNLYLKRKTRSNFHSVILAGVYDIKNLKLKIRSKEEEQYNSPWNIAADVV